MLLDVAHLKVSARSLRFDKYEMFSACDHWIKGYHFSDNDGKSDSNQRVDSGSWFWPYIKNDENYYSLEVYDTDIDELKDQIKITRKALFEN